jgi:hypothetical protein
LYKDRDKFSPSHTGANDRGFNYEIKRQLKYIHLLVITAKQRKRRFSQMIGIQRECQEGQQ